MGLFSDGEPASLQLILYFREDGTVGNGIPAPCSGGCWHLPELLTTDEFRSAVQKHSMGRFLSH